MTLSYPRLIFMLAVCVLAGAMTAQAAPISHGNLEGVNFIYQDIKEDSSTDPMPSQGFFGMPILIGDALVFTPTSFRAQAVGEYGVDLTDGALGFSIVAKPGNSIGTLNITEYGDFSFSGSGTTNTCVTAAGRLFVYVNEIDNLPVSDVISFSADMDFAAGLPYVSDPDGTWDATTNPGPDSTLWTGSLQLDIQGALQSMGISGSATEVLITFDNTLYAQSELGTEALIAKKHQIVVTVPEPGTITLLVLGLASLAFFYKKR